MFSRSHVLSLALSAGLGLIGTPACGQASPQDEGQNAAKSAQEAMRVPPPPMIAGRSGWMLNAAAEDPTQLVVDLGHRRNDPETNYFWSTDMLDGRGRDVVHIWYWTHISEDEPTCDDVFAQEDAKACYAGEVSGPLPENEPRHVVESHDAEFHADRTVAEEGDTVWLLVLVKTEESKFGCSWTLLGTATADREGEAQVKLETVKRREERDNRGDG